MKLVLVELDVGAEHDAMECSEVAGAELGGGMDLNSGHSRLMEHGCDGSCEFGWWASSTAWVAQPESVPRVGAAWASGVRPTMAGGVGGGVADERHRRS